MCVHNRYKHLQRGSTYWHQVSLRFVFGARERFLRIQGPLCGSFFGERGRYPEEARVEVGDTWPAGPYLGFLQGPWDSNDLCLDPFFALGSVPEGGLRRKGRAPTGTG